MTDLSLIRNIVVAAHIDHGKSTLADRLLQVCGAVADRDMRAQFLDSMDIERERGITIKAAAVRLSYTAKDGKTYIINLIDTPGHVDFSYEVSRALAACEGALLLVDASQGVEAQTLANLHLAFNAGLEIIPVLNKIDLPAAQPEKISEEIMGILGCKRDEILLVSGKTGAGVSELLEAVVARVPPPVGDAAAPARALIFDSTYDAYRGVISYVRVMDGHLTKGARLRMMATGSDYELEEPGFMTPLQTKTRSIGPGEVGYLVCGIRDINDARVGDTVTDSLHPASEPLAGYEEAKPMVFAGLFPTSGEDYPDLRDAIERLQLNDAALTFEPETSKALGFGFRLGFLGLLHMEITRERLEREFNLDLVVTAPNVGYVVTKTNGDKVAVRNPSDLPDTGSIDYIEEPMVKILVLLPTEYVGTVMELCQVRRGTLLDMTYLSGDRVELRYEIPLGEIIFDFFDALKSRTRGYASLDYERSGMKQSDLVRVDILLHGEPVDAFSAVVHKEKAYYYGRRMTEKLKELIPRQMFDVALQATIGSKVVARETIKARRKDVLSKCYGGDISRKRKLLEKQKAGKKRMKNIGAVEVPQEAFIAALQVTDESK